jgi:hypothetical protein
VSQALQQLPPGSQQGVLGGTGLHATETDFDALRKHHRWVLCWCDVMCAPQRW